MRASALLLLSLSTLSGCTLLVWRDASGPATCTDDSDCPAGEVCADGACDVVVTDAVPRDGTVVDVEGGVVVGPDGVELTVPAGALTTPTTLAIKRTTSTLPRDNFDADAFYVIEPARTFAVAATLRLPATDGVGGDDGFLRPDDDERSWQVLVAVGDAFELPRTGVVARGVGSPR